MKEYEIAVLFDPGLEVDLSKAEEQLKKIITASSGKIIATDNWGKRKLAYPINKNEYAVYVFYNVQINPEKVAEIESALNITNEIIRYLITAIDPKDKERAEQAKKAKAKDSEEEKNEDKE